MTDLEEGDDGDGDDWTDHDLGGEWRADDPSAMAPVDDDEVVPFDADHAAAVRTIRLVVAALVLALLAVLAIVVSGSLEGGDEEEADDPSISAGSDAIVGPPEGVPVEAYVAARQAALAGVEGRRVAVVSLTSYRPDTAVEDLFDGVDVIGRYLALPGGPATPIEGSITDWVVASRSTLQDERDEIAALLPTIEDPADPFIASYTEELALLDAQLAALDPAGELVFAVVVRADASDLHRLADRPDVRLVDVGPDDEVRDLTNHRGLRPEEVDVAGTPAVRPS